MAVYSAAGAKPKSKNTGHAWFTSENLTLCAFYLGVPLLVGLYGGLNNWQLLKEAGYFSGLLFYMMHALPPWMVTCVTSMLTMYFLRSLKPPPWVIMVMGSVAAAFIVSPSLNWLTAHVENVSSISYLNDQIAPMFSLSFWRYMLSATVVWLLVNYLFDQFLGLPRYRYTIPRGYDDQNTASAQEQEVTVDGDTLPRFLARVPVQISVDDVLAIKADQHYIQIYTIDREYMLLYRFSDAISEMSPDAGLQVHRSFWVANSGIESIKPRAKGFTIKLRNGTDIPVSITYHAIVKELARTKQFLVRS